MRILELCAGYGGLGLAVAPLMDAQVTHVAEVEPAAVRILAHRLPDAENIGDITQYDWTRLAGRVEIITAGWPCQDISQAGKRAGIDAGPRSGIWRNVAESIRVLRPRIVFLENVAAIAKRDQGRVLGDLAAIGYDARWMRLRAADIGAPHRRDRWFCIATPANAHGVRRYWRAGFPSQPHIRPESADGRGYSPASWWGDYAPAIRRWERVTGSPAPAPTEVGPRGGTRLTAAFAEWMQGLEPGWVTGVPSLTRGQMIKACGNGVVPRQAFAAYGTLLGTYN